MKILFINPSEITMPGGVHEVIRKLGEGLTRRGHEVTVLQFNPYRKPKIETIHGFRVIRVNTRDFYGFSIKALRTLSQLLHDWEPDIVHVHGYHTLFSPIAIMKIKKIRPNLPVVFSPHYGPYGHSTLAGWYLWSIYNNVFGKRIFEKVDSIIVASNFEKMHVLHDIPSDIMPRIIVMPHGVELIEPYKRRKKRDRTSKTRLLFAGYLIKIKGVQYIIQALSELIYTFNLKNVELTIVGEGPYKTYLEALAKKLKVEKHITWKPFMNHPALLTEIRNSDILLLLSKNENYGIIVAEALALGTPVVVTDNSALHEFLSEKGCIGVKYPPNPKEIASTIIRIIENPNKVGPFTKKIKPWEEIVRDYEKLYNNLVNGNEK